MGNGKTVGEGEGISVVGVPLTPSTTTEVSRTVFKVLAKVALANESKSATWKPATEV
jgi:hypothetical protein